MNSKFNEKNFEGKIVAYLRDVNGYQEEESAAYSREWALVPKWVEAFLVATQAEAVAAAQCFDSESAKADFYEHLVKALNKRGVVDVLRKGFEYNGMLFHLYAPVATDGNREAAEAYAANIWGVIRQVKYSRTKVDNAIDFVLFLNGLPLVTVELKNSYTGQTVENAVRQYQVDRQPEGEVLLAPKRCAVHFAMDDHAVRMCTELKGEKSWFLPFDRGVNGGAGNPVEVGKTMTAYMWEDIWTKKEMSDIIENFAQVVEKKERKWNPTQRKWVEKKGERMIWPRYHQFDAVRKILAETKAGGIGQRFLVQHSAGSGKSNTITWLAYLLMQTKRFSSVLVVTDRINLDKQLRNNIYAFAGRSNLVGWAGTGKELRELLVGAKPIIVTTINKFTVILDLLNGELKERDYAILVDEAHSSQSGEMAANMSRVLNGKEKEETRSTEEKLLELVEERKMAKNANYYAFTATPKNKTLEMFGTRDGVDAEGKAVFRPFHVYTMRQAIEEGFILDVLKNYTPYQSYYEIVKKVADDPEFDKKKSQARLRAYVEARPETIERKAEIIVEHFCTVSAREIGGKARAMVVTSSIERAIEFYKAIQKALAARKSAYKAIVAFTDKEIDGKVVTAAQLNGFGSTEIEDKIREEPYRILVVADMFQTGYDEPLLQTMYVDKQLSDLKAVQTLSRLNRACEKKHSTFVLDFANEPAAIQEAFQRYYKTTSLVGASDVNKLGDLIQTVETRPFYEQEDREAVVNFVLDQSLDADVAREKCDAVLDGLVERFKNELNEDEQIVVKSAMKNFCRVYPFFAAITALKSVRWEAYYTFYALLVPKLPLLKREDLTKGLLECVSFDKLRVEKKEEQNLALENKNTEIDPIPVSENAGGKKDIELELLSNIVDDFNERFGDIPWTDEDEVRKQIRELPSRIRKDKKFVKAVTDHNSDMVQVLFGELIEEAVTNMGNEKLEFMRQFFNNEVFRKFVKDRVLDVTKTQILEGLDRKAGKDETPPEEGTEPLAAVQA